MLDNKEIARWLDGIVPAWTLLDPESFNSLQRRPSTVRTAVRLAADLSRDEVSTSAKLVRLCTLPVEGILRRPYDIPQYALEGAILRPLEAFGLVERREDPIPGERFGSKTFYRKTLFFDRFLTFNVKLSTDGAIRH